MGPYCDFCGHRCFVPRFVPGSAVTILATCPKGMEHDRERTGYDHTTAVNTSDPAIRAYAAAVAENAASNTRTQTQAATKATVTLSVERARALIDVANGRPTSLVHPLDGLVVLRDFEAAVTQAEGEAGR